MSEESAEMALAAEARISRLRRSIEMWPHLEPAGSLFSSDAVAMAPWNNEKIVGLVRQMFSNVRITVEDIIESRGKVTVRWRLHGTWAKPFLDVKALDKPVEFTGISIYRFDGDKIVESDGEFDMAGLSAQALAAGVSAQQCQDAFRALSRVDPSPV